MDKLNKIFKLQRELNLDIAAKADNYELYNLMNGDNVDNEVTKRWVINYMLAMDAEKTELIDSLGVWWWKKNTIDPQNARVELIDMLHFLVSAMLSVGMDADDVFKLYMEKNKVNLDRQDKNYLEDSSVKLINCPDCGGDGDWVECEGLICPVCYGSGKIEDNKLLGE